MVEFDAWPLRPALIERGDRVGTCGGNTVVQTPKRHGNDTSVPSPRLHTTFGEVDVDVTDIDALKDYWYPLAMAESVADEPVARELLGQRLVLWRSSPDQVSAAVDRCPHRDAALSQGWLCDGAVVCPYHGWEYDAAGTVVNIPQLAPGSAAPSKARLELAKSKVEDGVVWVCLGEPVAEMPKLPRGDIDGWRTVHQFDEEWATDAVRLIENSFDPAHTVFVHRKTFGDRNPRVEMPTMERRPYGLVMWHDLEVSNHLGHKANGVDAPTTTRRTVTHYFAPFVRVLEITYPNGRCHFIVTAATPVSRSRMRLVQWCVRNDTEADAPAADVIAFDRRVTDEDRELLEGIWTPYTLDPGANVHLKLDRPVIDIRRILIDLCAGDWVPNHSDPVNHEPLAAVPAAGS